MFYGEWPETMIDHINGDRRDNKISNLRLADQYINSQNIIKARKDSKIGLRGVRYDAKWRKYVPVIRVGDKRLQLGGYETAEEAHQVYLDAKRKHHWGFAQ